MTTRDVEFLWRRSSRVNLAWYRSTHRLGLEYALHGDATHPHVVRELARARRLWSENGRANRAWCEARDRERKEAA